MLDLLSGGSRSTPRERVGKYHHQQYCHGKSLT